jgi:hypothetical protein
MLQTRQAVYTMGELRASVPVTREARLAQAERSIRYTAGKLCNVNEDHRECLNYM